MTESVNFLSDRFGDPVDPNDAAHVDASARLAPLIVDEMGFVATKDGRTGILIEFEFDDGNEPTDSDRAAVERLAESWPWVDFSFEHGDHIFNGRHAIWAFVPDRPLAHRAARDITERLWFTTY